VLIVAAFVLLGLGNGATVVHLNVLRRGRPPPPPPPPPRERW
jgi:hypothetical protein